MQKQYSKIVYKGERYLQLQHKKYSYKELREFKEEVLKNKNRNMEYILENIQAVRLLGWQILTGSPIPLRNLNGYGDVVIYSSDMQPKTLKLYTERRYNDKDTIRD